MKLIYTPKPGFAAPRLEWPARDHDEPSRKVAEEKIESGFFKKEREAKTDAKEEDSR